MNNSSLLTVTELDDRGRGVAFMKGAPYVCESILPGERIHILETEMRRHHHYVSKATLIEESAVRTTPVCPYFMQCGGCQLQHLDYAAQLNIKQTRLRKLLHRHGGLVPEQWLAPLVGLEYHYRWRARLPVYRVSANDILIGFKRRNHFYIQDISSCPVLDKRLSDLILPLHNFVSSMSCSNRIPQIELIAGESSIAAVLRLLGIPSSHDRELIADFSKKYNVRIYSQLEGPESAQPANRYPAEELYYRFDESEVMVTYGPTEFIQANVNLNKTLVSAAVSAIQCNEYDNVLELFSGVGNFTLPIARKVTHVCGLEGQASLVARAKTNAKHGGLVNIEFRQEDLYKTTQAKTTNPQKYNKLFLDPPREGAIEVLKSLNLDNIKKVVYVSCEPKTLARDLEYLVRKCKLKFESIQIVDMFPQTTSTEYMAVLRN